MEMKLDPKTAGFTLAETLIALVVLSVALAGMIPVLMHSLRGNTHAEMTTLAGTFSQDKLEELRRASFGTLAPGTDTPGTGLTRAWTGAPTTWSASRCRPNGPTSRGWSTSPRSSPCEPTSDGPHGTSSESGSMVRKSHSPNAKGAPAFRGGEAVKTESTHQGFTLVELMVTITVIAIIGLVATPGIFAFIPKYRVAQASRTLGSEIQLARMRAIAKNCVYHVAFDTGNQEIVIYEDDDNDWATTNTVVKTLAVATEFPKVSLDYVGVTGVGGATISQAATFGTSSAPVRCTLLPNGLLADSGVFYLIPENDKTAARSDRMRAVQVSRAGQVRIHRYDSTSSPPWEEY
jgi:prepilin-type N-terminal cleavage/methylation domain-containing protein